jgi:putative component of membrane protein insertase Oxa1/YidC/SpoIIIJ protein YidD
MSVIAIEALTKDWAIASLNTYQKYISPHKGFSCPHRLLHGGESCSEYVKQLFIGQDLRTALQIAPQRFKSCHMAARSLQNQQASGGCLVIPCCIPL